MVIGETENEEEETEKQIIIYNRNVAVEEIVPMIIKKNRCKKLVPTLNISWTAIQQSFKTRSVDDIRNFW